MPRIANHPEIDSDLYTVSKWTLKEIGQFYGISISSVYQQLKRRGVDRRKQGSQMSNISRDETIREMRASGHTLSMIGKAFFLTHQRVEQICHIERFIMRGDGEGI